MSLYDKILEIVIMLRNGSRNFEAMLEKLTSEGLTQEEAQRLLDRLIDQTNNE